MRKQRTFDTNTQALKWVSDVNLAFDVRNMRMVEIKINERKYFGIQEKTRYRVEVRFD